MAESFEEFIKKLEAEALIANNNETQTQTEGNLVKPKAVRINPSSFVERDNEKKQNNRENTVKRIDEEPGNTAVDKQLDIRTHVNNYLRENPKTKVLFAVPCVHGQLYMGFHQSCIELAINFTKLGIPFEFVNIGNESLVQRARNGLAAKFMGDESYTHMMFIDADITFPWIAILKLLLVNKELSGCCYPKKSINWHKLKRAYERNKNIEAKEWLARSLDYVYNPCYFTEMIDGKVQTIIKLESGMAEVKDLATGFMMIKRCVFDIMKIKYPERKYKNNVAGYHSGQAEDNFYNFFDTGICPDSGVYLSEDFYFCKLWRECGGKLWMDLEVPLTHTGNMDFSGAVSLTIGEPDNLNMDLLTTKNTVINKN